MEISSVAARVLGCLLEKQRSTPDLYPLSLNSLVSACNQTTNRWPVVRYDDAAVEAGLDELRELELVRREKPHGGRAIKFSQLLPRIVPMGEPELALICVLLLRGPQTAGELKTRTERLYSFADLASVDGALGRLVTHEDGPLVEQRSREAGHKEPRWRELLSGPMRFRRRSMWHASRRQRMRPWAWPNEWRTLKPKSLVWLHCWTGSRTTPTCSLAGGVRT